MKINYKTPECELIHVGFSGMLCLSGDNGIDPLIGTEPLTPGSDYNQLY